MSTSVPYRPDIDGLRALAVLVVILFHLGCAVTPGGFVGVDVFFVISGFLITSVIYNEIQQKKFSLFSFYERRIRRILPALFLVMAACIAAGWIILFPPEFEYFGQSVAATAGFGSNFLFWKNSGYFEMESALVPLLHTWTLAVEEQFYIAFPLYILLVMKFAPRLVKPLTIGVFLLSLAINIWGWKHGKFSAVFYLLPPRAWELLAGSILAIGIIPRAHNKYLIHILAGLGLSAILYAAFFFDKNTGVAAWPAVLGATLLIYTGANGSFVARALSTRAPVFTGKISYSLYLWHWPLIVFYNYASPEPLNTWSAAAVFIVSFVLSVLSWRFIEQPARTTKTWSRRQIFTAAASIMLAFIACGALISWKEGLPERFPESIQKLSVATIGSPIPNIRNLGFEGYSGELGKAGQPFSFIVWGDSHAEAATPALDAMAKKYHRRGYLLENSGCAPAFENVSIMKDSCNQFNARVLTFIKKHPEIKDIIMIAYWDAYVDFFKKHEEVEPYESHFERAFATLKPLNKNIIFVVDNPRAPVKHPALFLARAAWYGQPVEMQSSLADHLRRQQPVYDMLHKLKENYKFKILEPYNKLCENEICSVTRDGQSLYYDDDHLSTFGAQYIQDAYAPLFR